MDSLSVRCHKGASTYKARDNFTYNTLCYLLYLIGVIPTQEFDPKIAGENNKQIF